MRGAGVSRRTGVALVAKWSRCFGAALSIMQDIIDAYRRPRIPLVVRKRLGSKREG